MFVLTKACEFIVLYNAIVGKFEQQQSLKWIRAELLSGYITFVAATRINAFLKVPVIYDGQNVVAITLTIQQCTPAQKTGSSMKKIETNNQSTPA